MKNFKYQKQIILGISITLIICVLIALIVFYIFNNRTIEISTNSKNNTLSKTIPNVTNENTKFKISDTKNKIESVNISATSRLSDYNLYHYIKFDNIETSEIKNEDYLIFNDLLLVIDENCTILFKYELNGTYSDESYEIKISNIEIPEITSEKATKEELKKEKVEKTEIKKESTSPYYIKVNYGANVVTIYTKDNDGNYTVPYKAMVCSCGTFTPKNGTYKTTNKYTWRLLIHNVYGQYATRIVGSILFHSVPYTSNQKDTLQYLEFDKLGSTASAGCVRLTVKDSKWIYDNCPRGTMVEFYSDSNPGPLGKPTTQKISSVEECRNWDPTDPDSNNPWHTYVKNNEDNSNISDTVINTTVTDTPTTDTPTTDTPTTDTPTTDTPTTDTPTTDTPTTDTPTTDTPTTDTPTTDTPTTDTPTTDTPTTDTPTTDTPTTDTPTTDTPTTDTPTTDTPTTDTPTTDTPTTDTPTTDTPTTDTPTTDTPTTDTPTTDTPTTDTPTTDTPTTDTPTTDTPTTDTPTTDTPTTDTPTTINN